MKERKERQEDKKRDHFNFIKTKIRRFCLDFKKKINLLSLFEDVDH